MRFFLLAAVCAATTGALAGIRPLVCPDGFRPKGTRDLPVLSEYKREGTHFPQWIGTNGVCEGAIWAEKVGRRRMRFDAPVRFFDQSGVPLDGVRDLGSGTYSVPVSSDSIFFRGAHIVIPPGPCEISADEVRKAFGERPKSHPRLLVAGSEALEDLRTSCVTNDVRAKLKDMLLQESETLLGLPSVEPKRVGRRLTQAAVEVMKRALVLSRAYLVSPDPRFAAKIRRGMLDVCGWESWNPEHYLDTAFLLWGVGVGYDSIYDTLAEDDRRKIRASCIRLGFKTMDATTRLGDMSFDWRVGINNWPQTCWKGVVCAALAFFDEEPETAAPLIAEAVNCLPLSAWPYGPDGAYPEGPSYWLFGTHSFVSLLTDLRNALGTTFCLERVNDFFKTAHYLDHVTTPSGRLYCYSDGKFDARREANALLPMMADLTGDASVATFDLKGLRAVLAGWSPGDEIPKSLKQDAGSEFLFCRGDLSALDEAPGFGDWFAGGLNPVAVMRTGSAFLATKGGKSSNNHGHEDSGSFFYERDGVVWVADLGANDYHKVESAGLNLWDATGRTSDRWKVFRLSNRAHSVVTVDDGHFEPKGEARLVAKDFSSDNSSVSWDLSAVYGAQVCSFVRTVQLNRVTGDVRVSDRICGISDGSRVAWCFPTEAEVEVVDDCLLLRKDGHSLNVEMKSSVPGRWTVTEANSLHRSWDDPCPNVKVVAYEMTADRAGRMECAVTFAGRRGDSCLRESPARIVLTFDDGTADHYAVAATVLEKYGLRGVFNIVTDNVGRDGEMTWNEVRDLRSRGHEVATHTKTHARLCRLFSERGDAAVRREIGESCDRIRAETGFQPRYLCAPYTEQDERTECIARSMGLRLFLPCRHNFGACNEGRTREEIIGLIRKGLSQIDVMHHGVSGDEFKGYNSFSSAAAFEAHILDLVALANEGRIRLVDYGEFIVAQNAVTSSEN